MGKKKFDQVIAMIEAALRHGQSQSWMYESLGIAMELAGRSKAEIERAVMSAADFSTTADELMYICRVSRADRSGSTRVPTVSASDQDRAVAERSVCFGAEDGAALRRPERN